MSRLCDRLVFASCMALALGTLSKGQQPDGNAEKPRSKEQFVRTDQYGDPLPPGALARLGTTRLRHGDQVCSLAFSPDGKILASGGTDMTIRLWDVKTGRRIREFTGHWGSVTWLAFSPGGKTFFSAGDVAIRMWDVASGKEIRRWEPAGRGVALSPDGKILAANGSSPQLSLWEVATGRKLREFARDSERLAPTFSPDGKLLATGDRGGAQLWEVATGKQLRRFGGPPRGDAIRMSPVGFSADGKTLATKSEFGELCLWELETGKSIRWFGGPLGSEQAVISSADPLGLGVVFSPDGNTLLIRHRDGTLRLWEVATAKEIRKLATVAPAGWVEPVTFSPNGKIVALGTNGAMIHLWDVETGKELHYFAGHQNSVRLVALPAGGKTVLSTDRDGSVSLWEITTGKRLWQFQVNHPPHYYLRSAVSEDGQTLTLAGNARDQNEDRICVLSLAGGKEVGRFKGHRSRTQGIAVSADGKILAWVGSDNNIELRELATGKTVRTWHAVTAEELLKPGMPASERVSGLALSPDGKLLASGGFAQISPGPGAPHNVTINGVPYGLYGRVRLWDTGTGKLLKVLLGRQALAAEEMASWSLAFSLDGSLLATCNSDRRIAVWDLTTGKELHELVVPRQAVSALAFSPDGKILASAGGMNRYMPGVEVDNTIRLWEVVSAKERGCLAGHQGTVLSLAFSADGKKLVSGGQDTTVLVWDVLGLNQDGRFAPVKLSERALKDLWSDLAGEDASRAYQAICTLVVAPQQAVRLIDQGLRLAPMPNPEQQKRIASFLASLDDKKFAVRNEAAKELKKLGQLAVPALRRALTAETSAEVRRRVEELLEKLDPPQAPERLRSSRAIEILGHLDTSEANQLLRRLAEGASEAPLTRDALIALQRLARQRTIRPHGKK